MSLFLTVPCAPCGRRGVWLVGGEFVLHTDDDGNTRGCRLPPRDTDRFTPRQRGALDGAVRAVLLEREARQAA